MKLSDLGKGYAILNAGDWVGGIPFPLFAGVKLKVRRLWNPDFTALHESLPVPAEGEADTRIDECLVKACLMDWSGVDDAYSADIAAAVLADADSGPIFHNAILWAAGQLADNVKAKIEADEKN